VSRWYKRCGADFIHGTMMLTLEEKGAYSLCLDLIYDRGGPIPDDARWLAGVCGVSTRKWNAIRDRLLSLGKLTASNDLISNSRADFEILSADLSSRERAESGAKGGRKRVENATPPNETNDLGQAELKPIEEIREDKKDGETNVSPRGRTVGARLPDDWEPKVLGAGTVAGQIIAARGHEWATRALESFRNHWRSANGPNARKRDWQAAWANWVIEQDNRDGRRNCSGGASSGRMGGPKPDPTLELLRAARAAQRPSDRDYDQTRLALPAR
jgi:uncharacterized protein YdaU (DUF1376 family)